MEQSNIDQLLAKITQDEKVSWVKEETFRQQTEAQEKILKKMSNQLAQGHLSKINKNIDILSKSAIKHHQSMNNFVTASRRLTRMHADHNKKTLDVLKELREGGGRSGGGKGGSIGGGKKSTMAYSTVANGMSLKGMKSTAITTAQNATTAGYLSLGKALGYSTRSLLKFGGGVLAAAGFVTELVKGVAGIINTQAVMYNKLYNSGMKTEESLAAVAANARFTGLSYEQFGNIAAKNSAVFATAGFKVENFSKSVNKVTKASKGYNLSIEEGASYLGDYMSILRATGQKEALLYGDHTEAVQQNIKTFTRYSSMMGISRDQIAASTKKTMTSKNAKAMLGTIENEELRKTVTKNFTNMSGLFAGLGEDGEMLSAAMVDMMSRKTLESSTEWQKMMPVLGEQGVQFKELISDMKTKDMTEEEIRTRMMQVAKNLNADQLQAIIDSNTEFSGIALAMASLRTTLQTAEDAAKNENQEAKKLAQTVTDSKNAFGELTGSLSGFGTKFSETIGLYGLFNGVLTGVNSAMTWFADLLKNMSPTAGTATGLAVAGTGLLAGGFGAKALYDKFGPSNFRGGKGGGFGGMFSGAGAAAKSLAVSSTMGPEAAFAMAVSEFSMAVDKFATGAGGGNSPLDLLDPDGKSKGGKGGLLKRAGSFMKNNAKILKGGVAGIVGGMALDYGADKLDESGHTTAGAALHVGSGALQGASTGAMIGALGGPAGVALGAAIGGTIGGGIALYNQMNEPKTEEEIAAEEKEKTKNIEKEQQDKINSKNEEILRVNKDQRDLLSQIAAQMSQMNSNIIKIPMQNPMG